MKIGFDLVGKKNSSWVCIWIGFGNAGTSPEFLRRPFSACFPVAKNLFIVRGIRQGHPSSGIPPKHHSGASLSLSLSLSLCVSRDGGLRGLEPLGGNQRHPASLPGLLPGPPSRASLPSILEGEIHRGGGRETGPRNLAKCNHVLTPEGGWE